MEGSFEGFLEKNLKETHVGIPRDLSGQISVGTPKRISEVIPGAISGEKCLEKFLEESQVKFRVESEVIPGKILGVMVEYSKQYLVESLEEYLVEIEENLHNGLNVAHEVVIALEKIIFFSVGKINNKPEVNQGKRVVTQLVQPFYNSGRRVTFDNFFTSIPLAEDLRSNGFYSIGTLRSNKRELPKEFLPDKKTPAGTAKYAYHNRMMIASWTEKKGKSVLFLSTDPATLPDGNINIENMPPVKSTDVQQPTPMVTFISIINGLIIIKFYFLGETKRRKSIQFLEGRS